MYYFNLTKQFFRIMRISLFLTFFCAFSMLAEETYSQRARVTIEQRNVNLATVLNEIEDQTDYLFLYNSNQIDVTRNVSVSVTNMPVSQVLGELFSSSQVRFVLEGTHIVLMAHEGDEPGSVRAVRQQITISGTVTDENGAPFAGVTVMVRGTTVGVTSGTDGRYTIPVPDRDAVLVFNFIGYAQQQIVVGVNNIIDVAMVEDVAQIDELVVVGFGSQRRVNLTGAVVAVGADVFENRPVANIGQALQGVVPNLNISISNGQPNTVPDFNIRGGTHVEMDPNNSNRYTVYRRNPLILVDGVEYDATMLNQMNPNDIESVSVIMDASAAAIYGTKAAYGVMLITTKSGKFGQVGKVTYSYDLSFDRPSAIPDILDAYTIQEAAMERTSWRGGVPGNDQVIRLEAIKKYMDDPRPENAWYTAGG